MNNPSQFYTQQKALHEQEFKKITQKLTFSSIVRLIIFISFCFSVYFFFGNGKILLPIAVVLIAIFIFLVSRHSDLKREKEKYKMLIELNELELKILKTRDFSELPTGNEFDYDNHEFSRDIDLFGKKSFFQYLNRTALYDGRKKLAALLLANDCTRIEENQEAVSELAKKKNWRQEYTATAKLVHTKTSSTSIVNWLKEHKSFVPKFMNWLPMLFSAISVLVWIGYYLDYLGTAQLLLWLFIGIGITAVFLKKVNDLSGKVGQALETFQQYHQLLALIEKEEFESAFLKELKLSITSNAKPASAILKQFSKAIDALDQRNNFLFGFLANGFFLWDLRYARRLETWIAEHQDAVAKWFKAVETIDAYNSLGNFDFNHPLYTYPKLSNNGLSAKNLGHPLLDPEKRVSNDISISPEAFFIVTGANMAGKSTFLRTVALQIMMSNVGLPVCATSCDYTPIKLISSMRTSDSLGEDESYFFSELKRLKYIVDKIQNERYFIILDEILKGTNSTDKAIGSRKFLERLVKTGSTGLIATHDLSLCELSESLEAVDNYYFDAEIENDELHFDYRFKHGICQNMNASFLLRKMKIVEE